MSLKLFSCVLFEKVEAIADSSFGEDAEFTDDQQPSYDQQRSMSESEQGEEPTPPVSKTTSETKFLCFSVARHYRLMLFF